MNEIDCLMLKDCLLVLLGLKLKLKSKDNDRLLLDSSRRIASVDLERSCKANSASI